MTAAATSARQFSASKICVPAFQNPPKIRTSFPELAGWSRMAPLLNCSLNPASGASLSIVDPAVIIRDTIRRYHPHGGFLLRPADHVPSPRKRFLDRKSTRLNSSHLGI